MQLDVGKCRLGNLASFSSIKVDLEKYKNYKSVFRIRIRIRFDQFHLAGSGSTSGNVYTDPSSKNKTVIKHKSQPKL